jgi:hypothetical protein
MGKYTKAVVAALIAGYAVFQVATATQSAAGEMVTPNEWISIGVSALIAGLGVWAVPNDPPAPPRPPDPQHRA